MEAFSRAWTSWAGWPKDVICDRGLHNRGRFARTLAQHGICITNIGLEAPEQIGSVERHGDVWKEIAKRVVSSMKITGATQMQMLTTEVNSTKNDQSRNGGFAPSQWVLGKLPNKPGG